MNSKTIEMPSITLHNADCIQLTKSLPDNSVDMVLTDPPYFRVKREKWDNQWRDVADYLAWLDDVLAGLWRVIKPTGCIYMFSGSALASDTELLVRQRFQVLNHITWAKPSGHWKKCRKEDLRKYFPASERIIFAEHYGAEGYAKGEAGYGIKCQELKRATFEPLIDYFINARKALGITAGEINAVTGTQMCNHWFGRSQWELPSERHYSALQQLFQRRAAEREQRNPLSASVDELQQNYASLSATYDVLTTQYDDLRRQYLDLRRYFRVTADVQYTDIWTFAPVAWYPGKHPCEKPAELIDHILLSSSRPGDVIYDPFMGSGSTLKRCLAHNRSGIGVEMEEERFSQTTEEIKLLI